jgi:hypothetical protein
VPFLRKKAVKSSLFDLVIPKCQSRKISPVAGLTFVQGIGAIRRKTNFQQDIGLVRRGND